jgi:hypothetical protein
MWSSVTARLGREGPLGARLLSSSARRDRELSYKLVVVGGGAGGCGTASKFAGKLGKDQVAPDPPWPLLTRWR